MTSSVIGDKSSRLPVLFPPLTSPLFHRGIIANKNAFSETAFLVVELLDFMGREKKGYTQAPRGRGDGLVCRRGRSAVIFAGARMTRALEDCVLKHEERELSRIAGKSPDLELQETS